MSNIVDFNQKKKAKEIKKLYTDSFWYKNTYNSLGSQWLIDALDALNLPENYRLGSFSANAGWYEADAFVASSKNPTFYLSDLNGGELKDEIIEAGKGFNYIKGNIKAQKISLKNIGNKSLDVILDIKGALWYASSLKAGNYNDLIDVLNAYYKLLDKNGVLLLDWYDNANWKLENIVYHFIFRAKKREVKTKYFGEISTKCQLQGMFDKDNGFVTADVLDTSENSSLYNELYPLAKKMKVAAIKRKDILKLINYLKQNKEVLEMKYERAAYKQFGKKILVGIITAIICISLIIIFKYI